MFSVLLQLVQNERKPKSFNKEKYFYYVPIPTLKTGLIVPL